MEALNEKSFKFIRVVHKYPDTFYILTFIMAVDFGLNLAFQQSILSFRWTQLSIGMAAIFVAGYILFTVLTNILFAAFHYLVLKLFSSKIEKLKCFFTNQQNDSDYKNFKSIFVLRDEAIKEENEFKLKLFNEQQMHCKKIANDRQEFLIITFRLMLLLVMDVYFTQTESSIQFIVNYLPPFIREFLEGALLLLIAVWLIEIFQTDNNEYRIKWPQ